MCLSTPLVAFGGMLQSVQEAFLEAVDPAPPVDSNYKHMMVRCLMPSRGGVEWLDVWLRRGVLPRVHPLICPPVAVRGAPSLPMVCSFRAAQVGCGARPAFCLHSAPVVCCDHPPRSSWDVEPALQAPASGPHFGADVCRAALRQLTLAADDLLVVIHLL